MSGRGFSRVRVDASGHQTIDSRSPTIPREQLEGDRQGMRIQRTTNDATSALRSRPESDGGVLLQQVSLPNGDNVIMHRLGRKWQRVSIWNQRGNAPSWYILDNADPAQDAYQVIIRVTGGGFTADVEVT